jgi:hypothetical protein
MSLAYLILAHKNPQQFSPLLDAIYAPENFYAIHVDKKSPPDIHQFIAASAQRYSNVRLISPRTIHWGGWSMVQATLDAISHLLKMGRWQHFLNLSGQDYPLKNQQQIKQTLSQHPATNFLEAQEVTEPGRLARLNFFHLELPTRVYRLPIRRDIRKHWTPYWGSQWLTITRSLAEFAISPAASLFRRYFRHTAIPDEFFFPTLAMNSEFRDHVSKTNQRWIEWERDATGQIGHHPRTLGMADLPRLLNSDALFARKFDDENLLNELEEKKGRHL